MVVVGAQVDGAVEGGEDQGEFRAGIGVGDGTADGASGSGLGVAELGDSGGQEWLALWEVGLALHGDLAHAGADSECVAVVGDALPIGDMHDVDQGARAGEAQFQHWEEGLAAGPDLRVRAGVVEGCQGFGGGGGAEAVEWDGLHWVRCGLWGERRRGEESQNLHRIRPGRENFIPRPESCIVDL